MANSVSSYLAQRTINFLGALPISLRAKFGRRLGLLFSLFPSREKTIANLQLSICFGSNKANSLTRGAFASIGETFFESLNLHPLLKQHEKHISFPQLESSRALLAQGRGIVTLTGHVGNWDLLGAYISALGFPLSTIGRKARKAALQEVLSKQRDSYGIRTLWRRDGLEAKAIIKELKEGRVVSALIDQDTRVASVNLPFFGLNAKCPSGLVHLAKRLNAPVVSAFLVRTGRQKYKISVQEISLDLSVDEILLKYHEHLEQVIRECPTQWVWFHKRWRTDSTGKTMASRQYIKFLTEQIKKAAALIVLPVLLSSCVLFSGFSESNLMKADRKIKEAKYEEAVTLIKEHIESRLAVENRAAWENPYFHYLQIGDIYLQLGDPVKATAAYELAEKNGVETGLVSDRYRFVANWFEKQGKLREAVEYLEKYRDRDDLLMNMMLDRLARDILAQEKLKAAGPK